MPARPHAVRDSCYSARKPVLPMLPTTLVVSCPTDKSHGVYCNVLTNIVLARRARSRPLAWRRTVALDPFPDYPSCSVLFIALQYLPVTEPSCFIPEGTSCWLRTRQIKSTTIPLCRTSLHLTAIRLICRRYRECLLVPGGAARSKIQL